MALTGIYPMPEFYLIFTSYSFPYLASWIAIGFCFAGRASDYLINIVNLRPVERMREVRRVFLPLPIYLFLFTTLFSIGGATSANISLQSMGIVEYELDESLFSYFG